MKSMLLRYINQHSLSDEWPVMMTRFVGQLTSESLALFAWCVG